MDCRETRSKLPDLQDKGLSQKERAGLEKHLAGCADCREALYELEAFEALVSASLDAPVPTYSTEDLLARLDDTPALAPVLESMPSLEVSQAAQRYAAAAMLMVGVAGASSAPRIEKSTLAHATEKVVFRVAELDEALQQAEAPARELRS